MFAQSGVSTLGLPVNTEPRVFIRVTENDAA